MILTSRLRTAAVALLVALFAAVMLFASGTLRHEADADSTWGGTAVSSTAATSPSPSPSPSPATVTPADSTWG